MSVTQKITSGPFHHHSRHSVTIELASFNFNDYANLIVKDGGSGINTTIEPAAAKKLRDQLLELYPVPVPVTATEVKRKTPKGTQAYRGNGKHEWEAVTEASDTQRLRVPGGWLYATASRVNGKVIDTNVVFVPVPDVVGYAV